MPTWLFEVFQSWHGSKVFLERLTSVSHDALHIIAGTLIWLFLALIFRRGIASWLPVLGTIVVVMINELIDLWVDIWPERAMQAGEASKDVMTTILIPLILVVAVRTMPGLLAKAGRKK